MNVRHFGLLRNKRGISPAFSTMILTAGVIVMILVAMTYASNMLNSGLAENEFSTNEQFMQTAGLEIDDIAWTIGRTQTVSYQSSSGQVTFEPDALTYNVEVHQGGIWEVLPLTVQTGIILYNMPLSSYKMVNGYFHVLTSNENNTFLQTGSSAPISQVYAIQKVPMTAGNYLRVVAVPTIRILDSASSNCSKIYIPTLSNGTHRYLSQSLTLTGNGITKLVRSDVDQIRITADFPKADLGFDSSFFNFTRIIETKIVAPGSLVELYVGGLQVTIGQV